MELKVIIPEIYLIFTCLSLTGIRAFANPGLNRFFFPTAFLGLGAAWINVFLLYGSDPGLFFNSTYSIDGFSLFFKNLLIGFAFLNLLTCSFSNTVDYSKLSRSIILMLLLLCVGLFLVSSHDIFTIMIGLMAAHIIKILLISQSNDGNASSEAVIKSFLYLIICFLFLGLILGYFLFNTGVSELSAIKNILNHSTPTAYGVVFIILFAVLNFYIGAFPMNWPYLDMISGSTSSVGSILLTMVRTIGVGVLLRLLVTVFSKGQFNLDSWQYFGSLDWRKIIECSAVITMVIGALQCFVQSNFRRLIACIMLFQNGFMLLGILVMDQVGLTSVLFELVVSGVSVIGLFFIYGKMNDRAASDQIEDIRDKVSHPTVELVLFSVFLLSLVGVPPFPGFISKFSILASILRQDMYLLALTGVVSYFITIVAVGRLLLNFLSKHNFLPSSLRSSVYFMIMTLPILYFTFYAEPFFKIAGESLGFK